MLNAIPGNGKIRVEVIDNGPTLDDEAFARLSSPLNSTKEAVSVLVFQSSGSFSVHTEAICSMKESQGEVSGPRLSWSV